MKTIFVFLTLILFSCTEETLYENNGFSLYQNRVKQGQYEAKVTPGGEILSNYVTQKGRGLSRIVVFKFSLNGLDNERPPFEDHRYLLPEDGSDSMTPVYTFAEKHRLEENIPDKAQPLPLSVQEAKLTFQVDMRAVLRDFEKRGFYRCFNGSVIKKADFKGLFIAGGNPPLGWNFGNFANKPGFELKDEDGDGIFKIEISFRVNNSWTPTNNGYGKWQRSKDLSAFPSLRSDQPIVDALYNMSLQELLMDIRDDGAFMAGAKWPGVWTRDISYSILLSLTLIAPDAAKTSLLAKVKNGIIIQDTGTGGAWPVSTDRMTWALAAWEVYLVSGDREWLKKVYPIIKKSASADLKTIFDPSVNLMRGESSFLDWREQSYPAWMDPKDIYMSKNLGTNAVHFRTYQILSLMAKELGENGLVHQAIANNLKNGINSHLWIGEKGYYGQYLYGRIYPSLSPRFETLGESLAILFSIADAGQGRSIIANTPALAFGVPCFYPQISAVPPYHNNGVWPFVTAYWTWAAAQTGNSAAVEHGLASIYRAAALFLTNKENMVAGNGDFEGTEINSDRQLWSVAANLATVYRVFTGLRFYPRHLQFKPFIPKAYGGTRKLENFVYRNSRLNIEIEGYGDKIESFELDGRPQKEARIEGTLRGEHFIRIKMNNHLSSGEIHYVKNRFSPETLVVHLKDDHLSWNSVGQPMEYHVYKNGWPAGKTREPGYRISKEKPRVSEYQVMAIDQRGDASFLSEPVEIFPPGTVFVQGVKKTGLNLEVKYSGYRGPGYLHLTPEKNERVKFKVNIPKDGLYLLDFRYSNGSGPVNTDNKAAIRSLTTNGRPSGSIVFPQRGLENWTDWGYSSPLKLNLEKGKQVFIIRYDAVNRNMNGRINATLIDQLRLRKID